MKPGSLSFRPGLSSGSVSPRDSLGKAVLASSLPPSKVSCGTEPDQVGLTQSS